MNILNMLIMIVAPHTCVGCGTEGSLLCSPCRSGLVVLPLRCYRCRKLTPHGQTCLSCRATSGLYRVHVATLYHGSAKSLVWRLKFTGAQAAATMMVDCMPSLPITRDTIIMHVPTATGRIRQRGYDQAALMARVIARRSPGLFLPCLARSGQQHQRGAARHLRLQQLAQAFRVTHRSRVRGAHILLVDDVITTGATLQAAARVLKQAGAGRIEAVVFAQA